VGERTITDETGRLWYSQGLLHSAHCTAAHIRATAAQYTYLTPFTRKK